MKYSPSPMSKLVNRKKTQKILPHRQMKIEKRSKNDHLKKILIQKEWFITDW